MIKKFKSEKEFQIALGRTLKEFGFDVYTDKKICELPTFKGDRCKPDLLVFFKKNNYQSKTIKISQPLAIEIKDSQNQKFNSLSKSILQIKKYFNLKYKTDTWKGKIKNIILATPDSVLKEICYDWKGIYAEKEEKRKYHNKGIDWALTHILFSISNSSGILKKDKEDNFYIEFPNSLLYLRIGGELNHKPKSFYYKW